MSETRDPKPTSDKVDTSTPRAIRDLDVQEKDAQQVKGGRARDSSDPCEGGE